MPKVSNKLLHEIYIQNNDELYKAKLDHIDEVIDIHGNEICDIRNDINNAIELIVCNSDSVRSIYDVLMKLTSHLSVEERKQNIRRWRG